MTHRGCSWRVACLLGLLVPRLAAQPVAAPPSTSSSASQAPLSDYETAVLGEVLTRRRLALEPQPEGKWIEAVEVEALDVFDPDAWMLNLANVFHTVSRRSTLEHEFLFRPGQRYDRTLVDESARNLRQLRQLSLVLIVPVKGRGPHGVRLLVITKDVWSLRLNSQYRIKNAKLEYLFLQPSEENLAGSHLRLAGEYQYDLSTDSFGGVVAHHRLLGTRLELLARTSVIVHRETGRAEGSLGAFSFHQPLDSTQARWGYGTSLAWDRRINRLLLPTSEGTYRERTYDSPLTPGMDTLPFRYHSRLMSWVTSVVRSYGTRHKVNLSTGLDASLRQFDASDLTREGYSSRLVADFERRELERSDTRLGPFFTLHAFQNTYVTLHDVETMGLAEDFRTGYEVFTKAYTGFTRAQSTRDLLGLSTGSSYTASWSKSLARLWVIHSAELAWRGSGNDALFQAGAHLVSPPLGFGRLVYDGGTAIRYRNYRNARWVLGGDTRLRGYPSQQFLGSNLLVSNLEFRTRSVRVMGMLFGLVAFHDLGNAFDSFRDIAPKQAVGLGGRATLPQLQRVVGRLDVSFPLSEPRASRGEQWPGVDVILTLTGQAFPYPDPTPTSLSSPLTTYVD